jgi:hypothetical protein
MAVGSAASLVRVSFDRAEKPAAEFVGTCRECGVCEGAVRERGRASPTERAQSRSVAGGSGSHDPSKRIVASISEKSAVCL